MKGVATLAQGFLKLFGVISPFMPKILVWFFILYKIANPIFVVGLTWEALKLIAQNLLAAELTLRDAVDQALAGTFSYIDVFVLLGAVMFIYYVVKWVGETIFIGLTGSQAQFMAYLMGFFLFAIIEFAAVSITDGGFTFVPVKDGILYFMSNIQYLFTNFDWWPFNAPVAVEVVKDKAVEAITGNVTN